MGVAVRPLTLRVNRVYAVDRPAAKMLRKKTGTGEKDVKVRKKKPAAGGGPSSVNLIECWVSRVIAFSSQYNSSGYVENHPSMACMMIVILSTTSYQYLYALFSWGANQVIGEPKVYPNYGDLNGAWASQRYNGTEFIEVFCSVYLVQNLF